MPVWGYHASLGCITGGLPCQSGVVCYRPVWGALQGGYHASLGCITGQSGVHYRGFTMPVWGYHASLGCITGGLPCQSGVHYIGFTMPVWGALQGGYHASLGCIT